ncbi:hypothetical protein LTR20_009948 [Exophiala xenobiotica]|nr:hypothetical protein LTR40_004928 [Exophiala xenobiotica]KAK5363123.1 hypothetical protein LTS13_009452 [Exophiala xenobiotica]KAK5392191.1 hypothetical protein LTR79_010602 [Exophiala xenobiotica]KAK5407742.1 hypothetical protein LTR90_009919 [Exophiala xenobiotica]KAK5454710.1 hypothetical protein LTR20_009948 [Exophiala xenobiotica]
MSGPRKADSGSEKQNQQRFTLSPPGKKTGDDSLEDKGFRKNSEQEKKYGYNPGESSFPKFPDQFPPSGQNRDPRNKDSSQPNSQRNAEDRDKREGMHQVRYGGVDPKAPQNTNPFDPSQEKHNSRKKKDEKKRKD